MFTYKKDIKPEFSIIKNLFGKINHTIFSSLKLFNNILNHSNKKLNYKYRKKLKYSLVYLIIPGLTLLS